MLIILAFKVIIYSRETIMFKKEQQLSQYSVKMQARLRLTCVHGFRNAVRRNARGGEKLHTHWHSVRALAKARGHLAEFILRHFKKSRYHTLQT